MTTEEKATYFEETVRKSINPKKQVNIPLRRSRLSGKMETTCPDRRKPL